MTETVWGWVVSSAWHGGRKGPSKSCVKINTELVVQVLVGVGWSLLSPETPRVAPRKPGLGPVHFLSLKQFPTVGLVLWPLPKSSYFYKKEKKMSLFFHPKRCKFGVWGSSRELVKSPTV